MKKIVKQIVGIFLILTLTVQLLPPSALVTIANAVAVQKKTDELLWEEYWAENEDEPCSSPATRSPSYYSDTSLQGMRRRAEEIVNYAWKPRRDIITWNYTPHNGKTYFPAGSTVKGVPYTLFTSEAGVLSLVSLEEYKSKAASNYSTTRYCISTGSTRTGPVYGSCCISMVCEVLGGSFMRGTSPRYVSINTMKAKANVSITSNVKMKDIQAGDALTDPGNNHILWVGEVTDKKIVFYEQTPPIARKVVADKSKYTNSNGYFTLRGRIYSIVVKSREFSLTPPAHICDKGTFMYYESGHPHYNCYQCSICNKIWRDTSEPNQLATCNACRPGKPALTDMASSYNDDENIVFKWNPTANTSHYNLYLYKKTNGSWNCIKHNFYVQSGMACRLEPGDYKVLLTSFNSKMFEPDGCTWVYTKGDDVYFTVKHAHHYITTVTAPTCTAQGYTTHTCSVCGNSYTDSYTKAMGHRYTYKTAVAPTATAAGSLTGTCRYCDSSATVALPKLDTTNYNYTVIQAATCTTIGIGRYTWKQTSYGAFYYNVTIDRTAHNYNATVTEPTCTMQGYTTYTCSTCGNSYKGSYTSPLGHRSTYRVTTAPTTTALGVLTGTCSHCNRTTTLALPKLDTTNYRYTVTSAATCSAAGIGRYTWRTSIYGTFYFDVTIDPVAHSYETKVISPTCTEQGYTVHTCSACGNSERDTYTPPLGHNWDNGAVATEPTETTSGLKILTCTRCGTTCEKSIPPLNHTHAYSATVTPPTCTEQGYTTQTCSCGDSYVGAYVDALGHDFGEWIVSKESTEAEVGEETRTCNRCGKAETRETAKLDCPSAKFVDVNCGAWYHNAIDFAISNNIFAGADEIHLEPSNKTTRAMFVAALWRLDGQPGCSDSNPFSDVKSTAYYAKAVLWAASTGIAVGTDATHFRPNDNVTREQAAAILYRYALLKGYDLSAGANLETFPDAAQASKYAKGSLSWAVGAGLISGSKNTATGVVSLNPRGNATRAQVAQILMMFTQNTTK